MTQRKYHKKYIYLALVIGIMLFIFVQSALPADLSDKESGLIVVFLTDLLKQDEELITFVVRKCAHFTEYSVLGLSLMLTVYSWHQDVNSGKYKNGPASAWIYGVLYAISDEIHQAFVPGRSCEIRDVFIDGAGVFWGVCLVCLYLKEDSPLLFRRKKVK